MDKVKQVLGAIGVAVGGLFTAGVVHAQTITPIVPDSSVTAAGTNLLLNMRDTIFTYTVTAIPIAAVVMLTFLAIGVLFGWFARLAHHRA